MPTLTIGSYAAVDAPGVFVYTLAKQGTLHQTRAISGISNPSFVLPHPRHNVIYATSEEGGGQVYSIDAAGQLSAQPSHGEHPCHLALSPNNRWLLASNYSSGSVTVFPVAANGALGAPVHTVQHHGSGPNTERQDGPHAHSVTFAPDGRAIAADLGTDELIVYNLDTASGQLTRHSVANAHAGAGPRHATFNGAHCYVANELDCTVTLYDYVDGVLTARQTLPTLPADAPESTVADIHVSPNGRQLYVSNRGHDSLAIFQVAADGSLTADGWQRSGGQVPRNFAISPNGAYAIVANQNSGTLAVIDLKSTWVVEYATIPGVCCVQVRP